jgi:outer membrane protein OmpA-like peptidoglycan-associated protein
MLSRPSRVRTAGHTDTSGSEVYNMALSLRRANAVKDALVKVGVPAAAITTVGRGEAGLLVQPVAACASRCPATGPEKARRTRH